ncbi:MAG: two-component sensor histidine kinase, partial [Mycobacteriaceae bacterium]
MTRSPSLRTRVALASALGTTLVLVVLAVLVAVTLTRSEYGRLDARLSAAAAAAVADPTVSSDAAVTVRTPQRVRVLTGPELPALAPGTTTVRVNGTRYRVRTRIVGRTVVSVGEPVAVTQAAVRSLQQTVIGVALAAVAVAAALGWLFAGVAVRPLTRLADRTRELPGGEHAGGPAPPTGVRGAREVDQLAREVDALLERVETSQRETALALQSARDFAATAAHELRTPLTSMRT